MFVLLAAMIDSQIYPKKVSQEKDGSFVPFVTANHEYDTKWLLEFW